MPCANLAMTSMGWLADRPQASDAGGPGVR